MMMKNLMLNLCLLAVLFLGIKWVGPLIETSLFPVYAKIRILDVEPWPDGKGSNVQIELRKLRDCTPQGYAWYTGDFGSYIKLLNIVPNARNPSPSLPLGKFVQTLSVEGFQPEDLSKLFAETYSSCHPFWITRTVVYP